MPKKRVGVSLRKPSPAPEVAASSIAAPVPSAAGSAEALLREGNLVESASVLDVPAPLQAQVIEAFVNGANLALENVALQNVALQNAALENHSLESAAAETPAVEPEEALGRAREGYKELSLYLPEKLAEQLSVHCRAHDLDLGQLVSMLIENHLNPPVREVAPALPNERVLALAARGLLVDLAGWVRAVWATRRNRTWPSRPVAAAT